MRPIYRAIATPLASIFGSGFLVIVPILAGAVGPYSVFAMAAVCALAYAVGSVIRYNIAHAEPDLAAKPSEFTLSFERASDLALVVAYIVSVCLYIHILASFVLTGFGADTEFNKNLVTTAVIGSIVVIGVVKGLQMLENLELWALYITLGIIAALMVGLGYHDWQSWSSPAGLRFPAMPEHSIWGILTILGGTLIVVQGFETTRYLGDIYDRKTRIAASRWSQIISTAVYLVFVALALPIVIDLHGAYDDNSLVKIAAIASWLLPIPLILAAALSQFSAAIADTLAAGGNLEEATFQRIKMRWSYIVIGVGAIALAWTADTFQIVALASRAFAFYYMLQCLVAFSVSHSVWERVGIGVLAAILGFITIFAIPVS